MTVISLRVHCSSHIFKQKNRGGLRRIQRFVVARHRNHDPLCSRKRSHAVRLAADHDHAALVQFRGGEAALAAVRICQPDGRVTVRLCGRPQRIEVVEAAELQRELRAERRADRLVAVWIDRTFRIPEFGEPGRPQRPADRAEVAGVAETVDREQERIGPEPPRRPVRAESRRRRGFPAS